MKLQKLSLAIALVAAMGASASAAERPSQATLEAMGLGGMSIVSDADAVSIRGMGYSSHKKSSSSARAWGSSYASVHTHGASAGSRNGYDSKGKHIAAGANLSVAGAIIISGGGGGPMASSRNGGGGGGNHGGPRVKAVVVFAGGGSFAFAK